MGDKLNKFKHKDKQRHTLKAPESFVLSQLKSMQNNPNSTSNDLAALLEISSIKALYIKLYGQPLDLYKEIQIPKKDGSSRIIRNPNAYLKQIQRNLLYILGLLYDSKFCSHGFEKKKNIVTNAKQHVGKKYVLKVDLEDFFPSINFPRVYGVFRNAPFNFNKHISAWMAHICIYQNNLTGFDIGELPQGAPTSPMLSNLVCRKLDNQLYSLAKKYNCTYTRYADDITFSTNLNKFPLALYVDNYLGIELENIIKSNNFVVNNQKVKLISYKRCQKVTGIVVNKKTNLKRSYIKNVRTMLHNWESEKSNYNNLFWDNGTEFDTILKLFGKCKFQRLSKKSGFSIFKEFDTRDEENQISLLKDLLQSDYQDKRYIFNEAAIELALYSSEKIMHNKLYSNVTKPPLFKKVLLGKIGHIKNVRGEQDNIYRKLWNQYCKIIHRNKYKPLIIDKIQDHRLWELVNNMDENLDIEFKENYHNETVLQVINSYLNSQKGGQLILGIHDITREVIGIDKEIKGIAGEDKFRLKITNAIIDNFNVKHSLNIVCKFHKIYKKTICRIEVQPSKRRVYFSPPDKIYYIRQNGRKQKVEPYAKKKISKFLSKVTKKLKSIFIRS